MMAIITSLVSFASFAFSIYVFYKNRLFEKNQKKYDALTPIYMDCLLNKIPLSFSKLNFKTKDNSGVDEFTTVIRELIIKVKIIQIIDIKTYNNWTQQLMDIEDFVVNKANTPAPDDTHQEKILSDLRKMLKELYRTILSEDFRHILN